MDRAARRLRQEKSSPPQERIRLAVGPWKLTRPHRRWRNRCRVVTSLKPMKGLGWAAMHPASSRGGSCQAVDPPRTHQTASTPGSAKARFSSAARTAGGAAA